MRLSIIIPIRNCAETIRQCLSAIFGSTFKDFEVIVVDDASTDETSSIVKEFPCKLIELDRSSGTAYARKAGSLNSANDINVFIDSDICIEKDTLDKVVKAFTQDTGITAVVGMLSRKHPNSNFFSQYKNLYMHYVLKRCPRYINFIYGSFYAIKKECIDVDLKIHRYVEDTELGMMLERCGHKIMLDDTIEVIHLKKYNPLSFFRNDFIVPYYWSKLFIQQGGLGHLVREKRFCHARASQLASILISASIFLSLFFQHFITLALSSVFIIANVNFFAFLKKEKGVFFMARSILITWLDQLVMAAGMTIGFIAWTFKLK